MAEEQVIYDQMETGDPDPLGLNKRLAARRAKSDPLGMEVKLRAVQKTPEAPKQPAFQVQIQEPAFGRKVEPLWVEGSSQVSESGITAPKEFSFDKPYDPLAVEKLKGRAMQAQEKVHSQLRSNDKQYEDNIRQLRKDNYTINDLKEEYKRNGWVLPVESEMKKVLEKAKQRQYDLPVTSNNLTDIKTGTILSHNESAKFINKINNPELSAQAALINKYNEVANDPNGNHRVEKINKIVKQVEKGNILYDAEKNIFIEPLGLIGSAVEGVKNKFKNEEKHDFFKNASDATIINELENQRNNPDTDEPLKVPKGRAQQLVKTLAELPIGPIAAGFAGTIGGTFIGNPELGTLAATALGAYENRKIQFTQTFEQVYNEVRDQGGTEFEAISKARSQANYAQEIGTVIGAAQGAIGANMAATPLRFSVPYQRSIGQMLKQTGSGLGTLLIEGSTQGGLAAFGEAAKNKVAQAMGIKRDISSGISDAFWDNLLMTVGIGAAMKAGRGITKENYRTILHGLSKVPDENINSALQEQVKSGAVTQEAADQTLGRINEYKNIDSQIPSNVIEDARFKIQDNIKKIDELEQQKETTHKSLQDPIKEKMQKLTDENLALAKQAEKPVKPESGLIKSVEKEAIETAEEFLAEGVVPDIYGNMIKKDPIGFWRMIAQQAQNVDENGNPLANPISEQSVRDQFGDTVVDYAKELFPYEKMQQIEKDRAADLDLIDREIENASEEDHAALIKQRKDVNKYYDNQKDALKGEEKTAPATEVVTDKSSENASSRVSIIRPEEIKRPETITIKPKGDNIVGFKTSKGSVYEIDGDKTIRNKAERPEHPGDSGIKERSIGTVYLNSDEAAKAGVIYTEGVKSRQINKVGNEVHIADELENGDQKVTKIKYSNSPEVGLHPFEVFADGGAHLGNKITELIKQKENAIQERSATPSIVDEASGSSQEMGAGIPEPRETTIPQEGQRPTQEESKITGEEGQVGEPRTTGITHRQMDVLAEELGLPVYEKSPERVAEWDEQAAKKLQQPEALENLFTKLRKGELPDHVETRMMLQYMGDIMAKIERDPYNRALQDQLLRTKDLFNIAGRLQGKGLAARKGQIPVEETLPDFLIRDREANKAPLTDEQITISKKEYESIKAAKDAYEQKITKEKEAKTNQKAEKAIADEAKKIKKQPNKDYSGERKQILDDLKKKWDSSKGQLSSTFIPYADRLFKIAPDVIKLMKSYVEQGITELPDVIKAIHRTIKDHLDGVTEKDVHDIIAGEYNEKKPTRNQLSQQLYDLRKEAKLINELDDLQNGKIPASKNKQLQRNRKIEALRNQIKELRDEMGLNAKDDLDKLSALKSRYKKQIADLEKKIEGGDYGPDVKPEPIKLDREALELKDRMIKLKAEREARLAQQEYEQMSKAKKALDLGNQSLDAIRTIQTNPDLSFFGRQGIKYFMTHPMQGPKLFWESVKQAFSQSRYDRWLHDIHNSQAWKLIEESGLAVLDPNTLHAAKREEQWRSQLIHKIPGAGQVAKASERAFTSAANMARVDWFMEGVNILEKQGKTWENSPEEYKGWASAVNNMTGRGGLGAFEPVVGQLAIPFWSPRLIASNVNLFLNPIYYVKMPKVARIMLIKNMAQYVGTGLAFLALSKTLGAEVELDPRSSDFGKIKVGNTRYDIWGGASQYIRVLSQIFKGQRKAGNEISELNTRSKIMTGTNLIRTKLSPIIGFGVDAFLGENVVGEKVEWKDAYKLMIPMLYNDIKEAANDDKGGAGTATISGLLSFLGIGAQTYGGNKESSPSTTRSINRKSIHGGQSKKIKRI